MARKFQDMAAKGPKYTDREGKEKHRYQPLGKLVTEDDGRQWGTLHILGLEVAFSIFDQKERDGGTQHSNSGSGSANRPAQSQGAGQARAGLDDDIPFAPNFL
jgi:hypothetical protein